MNVAAASLNPSHSIVANVVNGVVTVAGADASFVNTLTEWLGVARAVDTVDGKAVAFQFNTDTYVFQENSGGDLLIQLHGHTGITDLATIAGAHTILVG